MRLLPLNNYSMKYMEASPSSLPSPMLPVTWRIPTVQGLTILQIREDLWTLLEQTICYRDKSSAKRNQSERSQTVQYWKRCRYSEQTIGHRMGKK